MRLVFVFAQIALLAVAQFYKHYDDEHIYMLYGQNNDHILSLYGKGHQPRDAELLVLGQQAGSFVRALWRLGSYAEDSQEL